jgi:hypothetical protein
VSDDVNGYPGAPPGWYADPAGGPGQRWWDGYAWTEATVLPQAPAPPPPPPPGATPTWSPSPPSYGGGVPYGAGQTAQASVGAELGMAPVGRFALAFTGIATLVNQITWMAETSQWRAFGHQIHLSMVAAAHNQTAPVLTAPSSFGAVTSLVGLCAIAAIVFKCIWQYRAATAARALGLPARHSPGWGVGSRFVPIVNFWMPYQAVRDCLPANDPHRPLVLRWWLLALAMGLGNTLTIVGLLVATPVGVVFAVLTALAALAFLATAPKVVTSIAAAHQAATNP